METSTETKALVGVLAATLLIIIGGAWLAGRGSVNSRGDVNSAGTPAVIDTADLVPVDSPSVGPENAPVTIVEFSDFKCPACAEASESLNDLAKNNPDTVRIVYRQFPLSQHQDAQLAAEASLAAAAQGKFWEYHDLLFANQTDLSRAKLAEFAGSIGLDMNQFNESLDKRTYKAIVDKDKADGNALGINATPTFYINGVKYEGAYSLEELQAAALVAAAAS
ncbi:MAG: thioredoxin domain-containing protein [Candidatus Andersenbacteria bacterium]|nr:thioredoxin domain-containing protein [bacterium]MDZ4225401.1 thioredoxin domain-containing protein [Candidatus Andersenbacteria bacterium]